MDHRITPYFVLGDLVLGSNLMNASSDRKVPVAVSQRSMSYLQERARDHLSDWLGSGQNTKVFYGGCP